MILNDYKNELFAVVLFVVGFLMVQSEENFTWGNLGLVCLIVGSIWFLFANLEGQTIELGIKTKKEVKN